MIGVSMLAVAMGVLARPAVRRRWFEVFHWSHVVTALTLTVSTLWHATR